MGIVYKIECEGVVADGDDDDDVGGEATAAAVDDEGLETR